MNYQTVIKHFGTVPTAARKLGYTTQAIYQWRKNGIPHRTQCYIEACTNRAIRAGKDSK